MNPLIGSRISLISRKNIRYEGVLYSINESDATVALQNVKSYGTEGREEAGMLVPPQDDIHPYLVFAGKDIKDLHVHETQEEKPKPPPPGPPAPTPQPGTQQTSSATPKSNDKTTGNQAPKQRQQQKSRRSANNPNRNARVGTGASLLSRKERGVVDNEPQQKPSNDFDFESNLKQFDKDDTDDTAEPLAENSGAAYEKNDFFDSISSDATDRLEGVDNRLRGSRERNINTETFGAVALNGNRRGYRRGGGRGRGRGRGRGGGRGRGRNRSRGGDGRPSASSSSNNKPQTTTS